MRARIAPARLGRPFSPWFSCLDTPLSNHGHRRQEVSAAAHGWLLAGGGAAMPALPRPPRAHGSLPVSLTICRHLSIVICGHVDSGKSTTTGRLIFELGGIAERELEKLKEEAAALGKSSFAFAFYMDRQKEERERGVTISCTTEGILYREVAFHHHRCPRSP